MSHIKIVFVVLFLTTFFISLYVFLTFGVNFSNPSIVGSSWEQYNNHNYNITFPNVNNLTGTLSFNMTYTPNLSEYNVEIGCAGPLGQFFSQKPSIFNPISEFSVSNNQNLSNRNILTKNENLFFANVPCYNPAGTSTIPTYLTGGYSGNIWINFTNLSSMPSVMNRYYSVDVLGFGSSYRAPVTHFWYYGYIATLESIWAIELPLILIYLLKILRSNGIYNRI